MASRTVEVPGISCGHCVMTIERELDGITGVRFVSAQQGERRVTVEWDDALTSWEAIRAQLVGINYPPVG